MLLPKKVGRGLISTYSLGKVDLPIDLYKEFAFSNKQEAKGWETITSAKFPVLPSGQAP